MVEKNLTATTLRGSNLGLFRLAELANPKKEIKIKIGDLEIEPIGHDTYGHPVISEEQYELYKAKKNICEREGKKFDAEVEYEKSYFCIKTELFDSIDGIEKSIKESLDIRDDDDENPDRKKNESIAPFKEMLIRRKQYAFTGKLLHDFVVFGKYYLGKNGKVYKVENIQLKAIPVEAEAKERADLRDTVSMEEVEGIKILSEVHIPIEGERCAICGKKFTIHDIANGYIGENENAEKSHTYCYANYIQTINWQKANAIMDAVYDKPDSKMISEIVEEEKIEEVISYKYHTIDGDIVLRIKNKVIEIKWLGKFKPFDFEAIFEKEEVTKKIEEDAKIIHAWSKDKAIEYLLRVKNSN